MAATELESAAPVYVLGVDPGLATGGLCVVRLLSDGEDVVLADVYETKKESRKQNVRAVEDNFRRASFISSRLRDTLRAFGPKVVAAEAMSYPPNASAAGKVAMVWGVLAALTEGLKLPMLQATPQQIKKCLCGYTGASKKLVREAVLDRYPGQFDGFMKRVAKSKQEHVFDAVGAVVACLDSDVMLMARGMVDDERDQ